MFIKSIIVSSIIALTGAGSASVVAQHALQTKLDADINTNIEVKSHPGSKVEATADSVSSVEAEADSNEDLFLRSNIGLPSIESDIEIEGDIKANSESSNSESRPDANKLDGAVNGSLDSSLQTNANVSL